MAATQQPTGNPVFDYKAGFRTTAQSIQRILLLSGALHIAAGIVARFVTFENESLEQALRYAPVLGLALIVGSGVWGYRWRSQLRADFQREFSTVR